MSDGPAPEHFYEWNEQMVMRHDPAIFNNHPRGVVRWVESARVRIVMRLLGVRPEHRVLDVGCGSAHLLSRLRARERHGLELSPYMLKRARERIGAAAQIILGDAEQMPYADASFDRVAASSLLSHVLHPEKVAAELSRVTKPGGRIVISISDEQRIEQGLRWMKALRLERILAGPELNGRAAPYNVEYHLQRFSRERLRDVIGTQLVEISMVPVPFFLFPVHWVAAYRKAE